MVPDLEPVPAQIDGQELVDKFYIWAAEQRINTGLLACRFEINRATPFEEWPELWSLWANHDCDNWGVRLTLIMERETTEDVVAFTGLNYSKKGCTKIETTSATLDQCEFEILPGAQNFALFIKGGFRPVWFEYEWVFIGNYWFLKPFYPF